MDRDCHEVIDAIADAVIVLDERRRVGRCNRAARELLRDGDPWVGRPYMEILPGTTESAGGCPVVRMWQSGRRERGEVELRGRRLEVSAHPITGPDGGCQGALCVVVDVTSSDAADSGRLNEEMFQDAFEAANVGKSLTLPSGEILVNDAMARMLGYAKSDLSRRTWHEFTHPDDLEESNRQMARLLSGEIDEVRLVKRYVHRDGSVVWADVSTVLRRDADGQPKHFVTTVVDITAQKLIEQRRHEAETRFTGAFFASPAGMTITRVSDGRFVDVNDAFLTMMEYSRDEVIGRTSTELGMWTPSERQEIIRRQLATGGLVGCELKVESRSGARRDVLFSSQPVVIGDEDHHVTTLIDITRRKRSERDLTASEERYRSLFENMNAGSVLFEVVVDDAGEPADLIIKAANRVFGETTGLVVEEALGRRLTEALPGIEEDDADWIGTYGRVALTGVSRQFEASSERLGRHFSVHVFQAGARRCAVTFHDVTERVRAQAERESLEQQLRQSQKLESVGRLAGGIAHDFNNMLSVILGYGETVLESLKQVDPLRPEVAEIIKAGRRSAELTRQLLAFSRKQTLQPEVIDLNALLTDLERMLRRVIGEDIELAMELMPTAGAVLVDPGQVQQVVVNLVVNARDAMPKGGRLLIEVGDCDLDADYAANHTGVTPGRHTMLAVTDTGTGMSQEVLDRIFEPFFTTKEKGKGTGLGLATAYGIVKQSGGSIWVYSELGRGTTFKIYFPATAVTSRTALRKQRAAGTSRGRGERVLVVEDDDSVRRFINAVLSRMGYQVTVAADGAEAVTMVEQKGVVPDLLLTDMVMPYMNSDELVKRLRRTLPDLRCLYMSGYTDHAVLRQGILKPGTPFIQKPFAVAQLADKIGELLQAD